MDHSKLPPTARDLIEAAEIEAQSIFDACIKQCNSLQDQANEAGYDPFDIGFSPGRPALEAARALAKECPFRAAGPLFDATALVYWQYVLKPDVTAFIALLGAIWEWAYGKFGLRFKMPDEVKRNWRMWALRERAMGAASKPEQRQAGVDNRNAPATPTPSNVTPVPNAVATTNDGGKGTINQAGGTAPAAPEPERVGDATRGTTAADAEARATSDCRVEEEPERTGLLLNVNLIKTWMDDEGWNNDLLAARLNISERTISSLRNNGRYHGAEAVTKLANLMGRDPGDLYLP